MSLVPKLPKTRSLAAYARNVNYWSTFDRVVGAQLVCLNSSGCLAGQRGGGGASSGVPEAGRAHCTRHRGRGGRPGERWGLGSTILLLPRSAIPRAGCSVRNALHALCLAWLSSIRERSGVAGLMMAPLGRHAQTQGGHTNQHPQQTGVLGRLSCRPSGRGRGTCSATRALRPCSSNASSRSTPTRRSTSSCTPTPVRTAKPHKALEWAVFHLTIC